MEMKFKVEVPVIGDVEVVQLQRDEHGAWFALVRVLYRTTNPEGKPEQLRRIETVYPMRQSISELVDDLLVRIHQKYHVNAPLPPATCAKEVK